jgi:hypothetical protein
MTDVRNSTLLTRIQNIWQYILFCWFLAVTILAAIGGSLAAYLARTGIALILVAILTVLLTLARQFHAEGKRNWMFLCYVLIGILAATALLKYLVH